MSRGHQRLQPRRDHGHVRAGGRADRRRRHRQSGQGNGHAVRCEPQPRSYTLWTLVAAGGRADAAERSLCNQLAKLLTRLDAILQRIDAVHAQESANHEAFLNAKIGGPAR
jgi:hypothetical protein